MSMGMDMGIDTGMESNYGLVKWMVEHNADHLWIAYSDYHGRLAGRSIPRARVAAVAERGTNFAKANFDFTIREQQVPDPRFGADTGDVLAIPDPDSVVPLPYQHGTAIAMATLQDEDGRVWDGCPRSALRRAVGALAEAGFSARVAFEPEFYLLRADGQTPVTRGGMYTIEGVDDAMEFVRRLAAILPSMDITLEQIGKEYGPGQFEANMAPDAPVDAADDYLLLRLAVRGVAREFGLRASFMPKIDAAMAGCGLHVHLSLQQATAAEDRTGDEQSPSGLSSTARSFMAGWLKHAAALCALGAPTPNSYKRLQPASWAPAHICWGIGNRAALVRVPGPGRRARLEFRSGDNTASPYLFLAGLIWAGLDGIEQGLDPGEPAPGDVGHLHPSELAERGIGLLPRSADAALQALERDEVLAAGLGSLIHAEFLRVKRHELATHNLEVTDWERGAYFESP